MLSIGAAFVCNIVIGVDCDMDALGVAQESAAHVELDDTVQFVQAQVHTKSSKPKDIGGTSRSQKGGG
jgi:predicted RNA methylase